MLRGLFVFFSSDSHVLNGGLGDEGWLAFVNTNCRHLEKGALLKAEGEGSEDQSSYKQRAAPLHAGHVKTKQTFKEYTLDSSWDQACLSKNISAKVCLCWEKLQPTLESSMRAYYHLVYRFNPQTLKWDLFWKLTTPLGGVKRHFTNWSCLLIFTNNPNTR